MQLSIITYWHSAETATTTTKRQCGLLVLCHFLVVHPLLRKILDLPLILQRVVFHPGAASDIDCEQSLFSSKIRGKECKTSSCASVPVCVTYERRCPEALVVLVDADTTSGSRHRCSHITLTVTLARSFILCSSPRFSRKRETARSLLLIKIVKLGVLYFYELATDSNETPHIY